MHYVTVISIIETNELGVENLQVSGQLQSRCTHSWVLHSCQPSHRIKLRKRTPFQFPLPHKQSLELFLHSACYPVSCKNTNPARLSSKKEQWPDSTALISCKSSHLFPQQPTCMYLVISTSMHTASFQEFTGLIRNVHLYKRQAKSQWRPSSLEISSFENVKPGIKPRFFSQKIAQKLQR